jgi:hypothetical protein
MSDIKNDEKHIKIRRCQECEEDPAEYICPQCKRLYCESCMSEEETCFYCAPKLIKYKK